MKSTKNRTIKCSVYSTFLYAYSSFIVTNSHTLIWTSSDLISSLGDPNDNV